MTNAKKCFVFGSAEAVIPSNGVPRNGENLYIAADRGYFSAKALGITPDVILGDFDSAPLTEEMQTCGAEIIRHPVEKDDTDLMLAIKTALERGFNDIHVIGCLGGERFDHSIATVQSLAYAAHNGARAYAYGKGEGGAVSVCTVIKDGFLKLSARKSGNVSILSMTESSEGVTVKGLKYSLTGAILSSFFPLGVSNSFVGQDALIEVENGTLLVIYDE
jgi:thiamine pyrophosphokinase